MTSDPLPCKGNLENLQMDPQFLSETDFKASEEAIKSNQPLAHFKLVYIKNTAREKLNNDPAAIIEAVKNIPGYYIFSLNSKDIRAAMHEYVDRMLDAVEKNHE